MEWKEEKLTLLTEAARRAGCENIRYFVETEQAVQYSIFRGQPDRQTDARTTQMSMEAGVGGFRGCLYLESLDNLDLSAAVQTLCAFALNNREPYAPVSLPANESPKPCVSALPEESEKIMRKLMEAEKAALRSDSRIRQVDRCTATVSRRTIRLIDDQGNQCMDSVSNYACQVEVTAIEGTSVQNSWAERFSRNLSGLDVTGAAREAALRAVSLLQPDRAKTGRYPVLLNGRTAAQLLSGFLNAFSGDAVRRGISPFSNLCDTHAAVPQVNLLEQPNLRGGLGNRRFDDEGTPTSIKYLIRDGNLDQLLYDRRTAAEYAVVPTGNAFRAACREMPSVQITNLVLQPGQYSQNQMLTLLDSGIYITEFDGLNAGISSDTGAFSLIAQGFFVHGGQIVQPLSGFTIGGMLSDLLWGIQAVGRELYLMSAE